MTIDKVVTHLCIITLPILHQLLPRNEINLTRHQLRIIYIRYSIVYGTMLNNTIIQVHILQGLFAKFCIHQAFKIIKMSRHSDITRSLFLKLLT